MKIEPKNINHTRFNSTLRQTVLNPPTYHNNLLTKHSYQTHTDFSANGEHLPKMLINPQNEELSHLKEMNS